MRFTREEVEKLRIRAQENQEIHQYMQSKYQNQVKRGRVVDVRRVRIFTRTEIIGECDQRFEREVIIGTKGVKSEPNNGKDN